MTSEARRALRRYAASFLAWTVVGLFYFSRNLTRRIVWHDATPWPIILRSWLVGAYISAALTPIVLWLGLESGRNYMNRAPMNNLDLSLAKRIALGGTRRLEVRIDAFNALNHTQFFNVNATLNVRSLTDPTPTNLPYNANGELVNPTGFGTANDTRPPRQVQILVRLQF